MKKIKRWIRQLLADPIKGTPGIPDYANAPAAAAGPVARMVNSTESYDPDADLITLSTTVVKNPVIDFIEKVEKGEATVSTAWLFEGKVDEDGKLMRDKKLLECTRAVLPYRTTRVVGTEAFKKKMAESKLAFDTLPEVASKAKEAKRRFVDNIENLKEAKLIEDDFNQDITTSQYDANQYTEYTPLMAGPFNKQLYLTDYLTMHSRAYEQWNHHPLAKRIAVALTQYAFGRRFKVRIKDKAKEKVWEENNEKYHLTQNQSKFWVPEYLVCGELMLDKKTYTTIDPSTIWDIITDPVDINDVYYYHQCYPTAYQTFTGMTVKGVPGSSTAKSQEFVIRQLPYDQVIHLKSNCFSMEKRGRSLYFPILGWLKRFKDLYNAQVQGEQLRASFIWDDEIDGGPADIANHAALYNRMPLPGSVFAHNKAIKRTPMQAIQGARAGSSDTGNEILALIATSIGLPKDFFNLISGSGGNRATALVAAEPFTKVIEDLQADFEYLDTEIAKDWFLKAGLTYKKGDIEFLYPSVTKDTTTETITNVVKMEAAGYISKQTAAEMAAAEMNITTYDYDDEKSKIDQELEDKMDAPLDVNMPSPFPVPGGMNGGGAAGGGDGGGAPIPGSGGPNGTKSGINGTKPTSPIAGKGKAALKKQMGNL
jgi:hypothetical protein